MVDDQPTDVNRHHRLIHDIYLLLDAGDRRVLEQFDLTPMQYRIMLLLNSNGGATLSHLSEQLFTPRGTLSRVVDKMLKDNWLQRINDPADKRSQRMQLTPEGRQIFQQAQAAFVESLNARLYVIEADERQHLIRLLEKMRLSLWTHLNTRDVEK